MWIQLSEEAEYIEEMGAGKLPPGTLGTPRAGCCVLGTLVLAAKAHQAPRWIMGFLNLLKQ